jgi:hypothetical protein
MTCSGYVVVLAALNGFRQLVFGLEAAAITDSNQRHIATHNTMNTYIFAAAPMHRYPLDSSSRSQTDPLLALSMLFARL